MNNLQPKHNLNPTDKIGFAYDKGERGIARIMPCEVVT